jgi:hypothetical protein
MKSKTKKCISKVYIIALKSFFRSRSVSPQETRYNYQNNTNNEFFMPYLDMKSMINIVGAFGLNERRMTVCAQHGYRLFRLNKVI